MILSSFELFISEEYGAYIVITAPFGAFFVAYSMQK